ncbi:hypothetical protein SeLEV6574_g03545 [Synchytrium endobioticum]|nr:hypothetical protein SeLEV6574_g03545 [Synchytrium endobioticum]
MLKPNRVLDDLVNYLKDTRRQALPVLLTHDSTSTSTSSTNATSAKKRKRPAPDQQELAHAAVQTDPLPDHPPSLPLPPPSSPMQTRSKSNSQSQSLSTKSNSLTSTAAPKGKQTSIFSRPPIKKITSPLLAPMAWNELQPLDVQVACPLCCKTMRGRDVDRHIERDHADPCIKVAQQQSTCRPPPPLPKTTTIMAGSTNSADTSHQGTSSITEGRPGNSSSTEDQKLTFKPLPSVAYDAMNNVALKKLCNDVGIGSSHDRASMIKRHQQYTIIYNANADRRFPKPLRQVIAAFREWDRSQEASSMSASSKSINNTGANIALMFSSNGAIHETVPGAEAETSKYKQKYNDHFQHLIAQARASKKKKLARPPPDVGPHGKQVCADSINYKLPVHGMETLNVAADVAIKHDLSSNGSTGRHLNGAPPASDSDLPMEATTTDLVSDPSSDTTMTDETPEAEFDFAEMAGMFFDHTGRAPEASDAGMVVTLP